MFRELTEKLDSQDPRRPAEAVHTCAQGSMRPHSSLNTLPSKTLFAKTNETPLINFKGK